MVRAPYLVKFPVNKALFSAIFGAKIGQFSGVLMPLKLITNDSPAPVVETPLTLAREREAQANAAVVACQAEVTEAALLVERFETPLRGFSAAKWRLDLAQAGDRLRLQKAIAGGEELGSPVSQETEEARRAVDALAETAAAAEAGLPQAQTEHRRAIERHSLALAAWNDAELEVEREEDLATVNNELFAAYRAVWNIEEGIEDRIKKRQVRTDQGDRKAALVNEQVMAGINAARIRRKTQ
jgi:hypothetical protein